MHVTTKCNLRRLLIRIEMKNKEIKTSSAYSPCNAIYSDLYSSSRMQTRQTQCPYIHIKVNVLVLVRKPKRATLLWQKNRPIHIRCMANASGNARDQNPKSHSIQKSRKVCMYVELGQMTCTSHNAILQGLGTSPCRRVNK